MKISSQIIRGSVVFFIVLTVFLSSESKASAATSQSSIEVSGWIPYWRDSQGIKDAKEHIDDIDTLNPFVFSTQSDGSIKDLSGLDKSAWQSLFRTARKEHVEIIPTVMWSDGASIDAVLRNPVSRALHVGVIAAMVQSGKYDGVDIDYEAKKAETKDYFSQFLKELKVALKGKTLSCTVEARTPPDSLYKEIPSVIQYSNDYAVIGTVCDRIQIMAYDQQRADLKLNASKAGEPYMPVADTDWVEKVVALAVKSLPKDKISLGIASYGNHYAITVAPDWYRDYKKIGALNAPDIQDIAHDYRVKPSKNRAGEMSFSYMPKNSTVKIPSSIKAPKGTSSGNMVAARALAYANKTGQTVTFNYASWSDVNAMMDKVDLAKKYGLRGIALFKIDGEEDQKFWRELK